MSLCLRMHNPPQNDPQAPLPDTTAMRRGGGGGGGGGEGGEGGEKEALLGVDSINYSPDDGVGGKVGLA